MTAMTPVNLLDFDLEGLAAYCETLGEKRFRATQLFRWIHQRGVADFGQMSDLAKSLQGKLAGRAHVTALPVISQHESKDGTIKWLFDIGGGNAVEAVFIPEDDRGTLCVSSQAGCAVGCRFCSTGHQGFSRNLTTGEIVAQLWFAEHFLRRRLNADAAARNPQATNQNESSGRGAGHAGTPQPGSPRLPALPPRGEGAAGDSGGRVISNVVMMGMGEPLQNYDRLVPALRTMLHDHGYGLSRRRVTVSTSGVVPMIERLARDCPVALAVSLHAPTDALRDHLVPLNRKYPIDELLRTCTAYLSAAPRDFITFEYCMLDGVNDQPEHAEALIALMRRHGADGLKPKFNLIPFNPFPQSGLTRSPMPRVQAFGKLLNDAGIVTTVRKTRGDDIDAACGQLAGDVRDRTRVAERMARQRSVVLHPVPGAPTSRKVAS